MFVGKFADKSRKGILTLTGTGNTSHPNASDYWYFQIESALTVGSSARVRLRNGARPCVKHLFLSLQPLFNFMGVTPDGMLGTAEGT